MIIKKTGIKGKNENEYRAEIIISDNKVDIFLYLQTENRDVRVRSDFYLGKPEKDLIIKKIKLAVKMYEEIALNYPTLDDWDGKVY